MNKENDKPTREIWLSHTSVCAVCNDRMLGGKHRRSYMSAHVLLNELGKSDKMRGLSSIFIFFATF